MEELERRKTIAYMMGGKQNIEKQHKKGMMTVRERINKLIDNHSFLERGILTGASTYDNHQPDKLVGLVPCPFVMGIARIDGKRVAIHGDDYTIKGASVGRLYKIKGRYFSKMARAFRLPVIRLIESGGGTIREIAEIGYTELPDAPAMFLMEFQTKEFQEADFTNVEAFAWAGSAAPELMVNVLSGICSKTGSKLLTGYGSTEVCGFVTYTEKDDDISTLLHTAGRIAEPFELKIVDDSRREMEDFQIGEIAVRGPFMFSRYWNMPEQTGKVLDREGWYYTGDLAYKDERGYIHITGRTSEMFKSGGENVYPREVEEVIELDPAVLFAAVIAVPDEVYQEVGWAYIMLQPGKETTEESVEAICREKLANYKVPKKFFIRSGLPLLPNGKINKSTLKEEALGMLDEK